MCVTARVSVEGKESEIMKEWDLTHPRTRLRTERESGRIVVDRYIPYFYEKHKRARGRLGLRQCCLGTARVLCPYYGSDIW